MGRAVHVRPVSIAAIGAVWLVALAPALAATPPSLSLPDGVSIVGDVSDESPTRSGPVDLGALADTALAQADLLPASSWDLDTLALELAFDLPAMHAFVRDHIADDPYAGMTVGMAAGVVVTAAVSWAIVLLELWLL